jgi:hypothetical protein
MGWRFIPGKKIFQTVIFRYGCIAMGWRFIHGKKYSRHHPLNLLDRHRLEIHP